MRYAQELNRLGRHDEARELLGDLVPRMRDTYGDADRLTGFALEASARAWIAAGELDLAEELLLEAYDLLDNVDSEADARMAVRYDLARIWRQRGDTEVALDYLEQAIELAPWALRKEAIRETFTFGIDYFTELRRPLDVTRCKPWLESLDD